ncbi:uncharacterized protein [Arachis hypogaea]|uniref:uncharacterized protein n=1 Tax=Arachis hypogaea TaxID=3818 RepID=UPI003B20E739
MATQWQWQSNNSRSLCYGGSGYGRGSGVRKVKRRMMMMRVFWSKNSGNDDFKAFLNVEEAFNNKKDNQVLVNKYTSYNYIELKQHRLDYNSIMTKGQTKITTQANLNSLYVVKEDKSKFYTYKKLLKCCMSYYTFTSMDTKIDCGKNNSRGPPTFILFGENYHLMGSLIPPEGNMAKFTQLYVFDTQNEVQNCMAAIRGEENKQIHEDIVRYLEKMLDDNNILVKTFRMVRDSIAKDSNNSIKLRLLGKRRKDGRRYNLPSIDEVAGLIVGDFDINKTNRDIIQGNNYQDAMAICKMVGYPDLFITFTCNPKWPEVEDFLKNRELNFEDRPDIICRAFKAKLNTLIKDIRANKIFEKVSAVTRKPFILSAEKPNKETDANYFEAVEKHMMHGLCGLVKKDSPCMEYSKCIRHFPKKFFDNTTIDDDGYPVYRHMEDGRTIKKPRTNLDNRYVVSHNRLLLMRYGAHINVEWCNQSRSIKYLFKYVNKGRDRVAASFYKSAISNTELDEYDEVSMYYDCRYMSLCEAAWRIFGYNIHYRDPFVVRLGFHLHDEQNVIFKDHENLDDVVKQAFVKEYMFIGWFQANRDYVEARSLTYAELPTKFVWKAKERVWLPRKTHYVIGRIFFVPPGSGESYYLILLLNFVKGLTCYEDIRTVDDVVYSSFKYACYARGLLDDDKEYIDAIEDASHWGSGAYLRKLFATLLFSNSMDRPEHV